MQSSLVIPKKKDGRVWNETIPFHPLQFGWTFVKACCCEADFTKGIYKMKVAKGKNRLRVFAEEKEVLTYTIPESQMEFFILQNRLQ